MKRRTYLAVAAAVAVAGCSTADDDPPTDEDDDSPGRTETEQERQPIDSVDRLIDQLESATEGDVITVPPDVTIDLTDHWEISVPSGVTLSGGRRAGVPGALLRSPEGDKTPESETFIRKLTLNEGARLTGFRLKGHHHAYVDPEEEHDGDYHAHRAGGGVTAKEESIVDNNEISGWPFTGVYTKANAHIHSNYIHHNAWDGLGYGVANYGGNPLIEWNYFDANRHSIACSGEGGYVARYNHFGPITYSHVMDVHSPGGTRIEIYNNTVEAVESAQNGDQRPAVAIRGTPEDVATINNNWFYNSDEPLDTPDGWTTRHAIIQVGVDEWTNVEWSGNHYGNGEPSNDAGAPEIRQTWKPADPELPNRIH